MILHEENTCNQFLQIMLMVQVGPTGCVVGIEHIKELVEQLVKNVQKDTPDLLKEERIKLISESSAHI